VVNFHNLTKAAVALALGTLVPSLSAQGFGEPGIQISLSKLKGDYGTVTGNKLGLAFTVEGGYRLDKSSALIGQFGYFTTPGNNELVSYNTVRTGPNSFLPATGVNPSYFEQRVRKYDVEGFRLGALYRYELTDWNLYLQGGVRVNFNKTTVTDTGTMLTTNGLAATTQTSVNIIAVTAIADKPQKKSTAISPVLGAGLRLGERATIELNVVSAKADSPDLTSKAVNAAPFKKSFSGVGIELGFGIRF